MNIKFVTIETRRARDQLPFNTKPPFEYNLIQSAKINKIDIEVLGKGVHWEWFITKLEILDKYLTNVKEDYFCFTDSVDVLFLDNENNIFNLYNKHFLNKIVFNAEINCWPDKSLSNHFKNKDSEYKYLNSGCYIGPTKLIHQVIKECIKFSKENYVGGPRPKKWDYRGDSGSIFKDDQYLFQQMYLGLFKDNMVIDYKCKLFQTLYNAENHVQYLETSVYNNHTNSTPLIIHGNGKKSLRQSAEVFCRKHKCTLKETFSEERFVY